jgi:hypothetical protein
MRRVRADSPNPPSRLNSLERRAARGSAARRLAHEHVAAQCMRDDDPLLAVTVPSLVGARPQDSSLAEELPTDPGDGDDAASMGTVQTAPYSLFIDLYRGVARGAYALDDLHAPGLLAWILMGFVPGVGTLAALRDGYYSLEVREWGALLLNLLGLIPFIKGFANIADLALLHRLRHTAHVSHQVARVARHQRGLRVARRSGNVMRRSATAATGSTHAGGAVVLVMNHERGPRQNAWAWPAALLALITFALAPMDIVVALLVVGGQSLLAVSAPLLVVVAAAVAPVMWCVFVLLLAVRARHIARRLRGRPFARPGVSSMAFWLGLCAFLLTALGAGIALLSAFSLAHP